MCEWAQFRRSTMSTGVRGKPHRREQGPLHEQRKARRNYMGVSVCRAATRQLKRRR
jgi:hypothetical protein